MAEDGLLSISEFAKLTGIPRSKLIYYDDIGLFTPKARGQNNYRYYSMQQIITANFVNDLTAIGVPLKKMVELAKSRSPEAMRDLLQVEEKEYQRKIQEYQETLDLLKMVRNLIEAGLDADVTNITVKTLKPMRMHVGPDNEFQDSESFYPAWITFLDKAQEKGHNLKFPVGGMFDTYERFTQNHRLPSRFYFMNQKGKTIRPAGKFLVGYTHGFYGESGDLSGRLNTYAQEHGLTLGGPVYQAYLWDELSVVDPDNYLMQISIPIVEKE
jgi:DNA-binding transcriptional MerR regulator